MHMPYLGFIHSIEVSSPLKEFFYNDYIVEIFGGLCLSIMGLFLIWFLRPKVKISNSISYITKGEDVIYSIKVINKSYIFRLIDLHFELTMLKPVTSPNGMNLALKKVELKSDHVWYLSRRKPKWLAKNDYATYAIIIKIKEGVNLLDEWKSDESVYLDFKVIAKNNFSGITSINHQKYQHSSCIEEGVFEHGNTLNIRKSSN